MMGVLVVVAQSMMFLHRSTAEDNTMKSTGIGGKQQEQQQQQQQQHGSKRPVGNLDAVPEEMEKSALALENLGKQGD